MFSSQSMESFVKNRDKKKAKRKANDSEGLDKGLKVTPKLNRTLGRNTKGGKMVLY